MVVTDIHREILYGFRRNLEHFFEGKVSVGGAFSWEHTPQGYSYWSEVNRNRQRHVKEKLVVDYLLAAGAIDLVPAKYRPKVDEELLWD